MVQWCHWLGRQCRQKILFRREIARAAPRALLRRKRSFWGCGRLTSLRYRVRVRHGWATDIADFAKYALLRRLAASDLRIGVLWYLTTHASPGRPLASYLSRSDLYSPLDPQLFEALRTLRNDG